MIKSVASVALFFSLSFFGNTLLWAQSTDASKGISQSDRSIKKMGDFYANHEIDLRNGQNLRIQDGDGLTSKAVSIAYRYRLSESFQLGVGIIYIDQKFKSFDFNGWLSINLLSLTYNFGGDFLGDSYYIAAGIAQYATKFVDPVTQNFAEIGKRFAVTRHISITPTILYFYGATNKVAREDSITVYPASIVLGF